MKPPPHAPEAEAAILGGILLRPDALREVEGLLEHDDFWRPQSRAVFRAMRILAERGESIDVVTVDAQLRRTGESELVGGIEALVALDRHAMAGNIRSHAEIVRETAQARRVVELGRRMAEELAAGDIEDQAAYLAQRAAELDALAKRGRSGRDPWSGGKVFHDLFAEKMAEANGAGRAVSTGIPDLDRMIKGKGYRPGMLIILGGRPKMGKTSKALAMTRAALFERRSGWPVSYKLRSEPTPVLWACDEMRAVELMERTVSDVAGIRNERLGSPSVRWLSDNMQPIIMPAGRLISSAPLHFVPDSDTHHLDRIMDYARQWRAKHPIIRREDDGKPVRGPAILVADYLQRFADMPGTSRHARSDERVGAKTKALKTLAQELDIVVILLAQLNRECEARDDKRPLMSDFRDSGEIEQEADVLMVCYRDIVYDKNAGSVYRQIEELTRRSGVSADDLDGLLAMRADPFCGETAELKRIRSACSLHESSLEELAAARRRVTDTEIIVRANRHGPIGTVHADFYGEHYRFLPRPEEYQ